jgi:hypothetical protein
LLSMLVIPAAYLLLRQARRPTQISKDVPVLQPARSTPP